MGCWGRLPAEIRHIILKTVADNYLFVSEPYVRAGYASVCREWQPVFESRNFQRLVLDQERVRDLERFVGSNYRRDYLEHLFLRVRLGEYDCTVCQSHEDSKTQRK